MLRFPAIPLALAALVACGAPEHEERAAASTTSTTSPSAAAQATARPPRSLSETERASMLRVLAGDAGPVRKVWFAVAAGDRESTALKDAFEGVFKQAGWDTVTQTITGMVLKPGLSILVASEDPPSYVVVAQQALESTSFTFKVGSGYRGYFEERRRADPTWTGIPLAADQEYVVVVGPQ